MKRFSRKFNEIPILVTDENENEARLLMTELGSVSGLRFTLRKSRYGCDTSLYPCVLCLDSKYDDAGVTHIELPCRDQGPKYLNPRDKRVTQLRDLAEKITGKYLS